MTGGYTQASARGTPAALCEPTPGSGLLAAARPHLLPMPAAALILYICGGTYTHSQ
jgi:hypothetical protein